jgi:kynurenine formamidase
MIISNKLRFIKKEDCKMNIGERAAQAAANGHETLDTDSSAVAEEKGDLACERYVLDNDKLQVEVLANLDKVQPAGAVVIVSYPRIEGATGLPARVWAITE